MQTQGQTCKRKADHESIQDGPLKKTRAIKDRTYEPNMQITCMASMKVFGTFELLENILLHLPVEDVIVCQRVCGQFRDIVFASSELKQMLFLPPSTSWETDNSYSCHNCVRAFVRDLIHDKMWVQLNPLLQVFKCGRPIYSPGINIKFKDIAHATQFLVSQERGSWRYMHLTYPSCPSVSIHLYRHNTNSPGPNYIHLGIKGQGNAGITLGHLFYTISRFFRTRWETSVIDFKKTSIELPGMAPTSQRK